MSRKPTQRTECEIDLPASYAISYRAMPELVSHADETMDEIKGRFASLSGPDYV